MFKVKDKNENKYVEHKLNGHLSRKLFYSILDARHGFTCAASWFARSAGVSRDKKYPLSFVV